MEPFKNSVNLQVIASIGDAFAASGPFTRDEFVADAGRGLEDLELKARVRHITAALRAHLPDDPAAAVTRVVETAQPESAQPPLSGFAAWPLIDFVGDHGLDCPEVSLAALRRLTPMFSAEFAIRPFIERYPDLAFERLHEWVTHENEHVRRLVSEGTRPRLPWGARLRAVQAEPGPVIALLERLRDDPAEYVRRSVANNLNDIAKDHPNRVVDICRQWSDGASPERQGLVRHGLRSLIKAGHPGALLVLGYDPDAAVEVRNLAVSPATVAVGGAVQITFEVESLSGATQPLVVDYVLHYVKANGGRKPKIFKLKNVQLGAGKTLSIRKKQSFKVVTTRVLYPGVHAVEVLINGRSHGQVEFELTEE